MSSMGDGGSAAPRALTAAEKRAARRARVLEGGEMRMKLVTGEIGSLKTENETSLDRAMDEGIKELLDATELPEQAQQPGDADEDVVDTEPVAATGEIKIPARVDPAQRRRDAHARRQSKEAMVQEILNGGASATTTTSSTTTTTSTATLSPEAVYAESVSSVRKELSSSSGEITTTKKPTKTAEPAFSRHSIALRLQSAEEKIILLLIFGAAIYVAFATDLRNVTTDLLTSDPRFLSYQQLVANGVPLESIRQQMHRENMEPSLLQQIERVFAAQRKSEMSSSSSSSLVTSLIPNLLDLPGFFTSLMFHPPIILCVLLLRVVVSLLGSSIHSVLKLPEVKNPQEDDLGFVANLALSSRPALKGYITKARKSVDDLFFFLWSFVLAVAVRAITIANF